MSYNMYGLTNFGSLLIELSLALYLFTNKSISLRSINLHLRTPKKQSELLSEGIQLFIFDVIILQIV